jgi:pre-mRNA-processing factor 40
LSSLEGKDKEDSRFSTSSVMSDSDRQLYFADFVIALQAAEDDKRRRIRDARRRAEKAQREAYREALRKLAVEGKILPYTRWRGIEEIVSTDNSFNLVQAQDRDAARELFEEFVDEWEDAYRRERSFLSRLLNPPNKAEIVVKVGAKYDGFTKVLLDAAAYSPDIYGDARRIINREEPVSSARLYYDELISRASDSSQRQTTRRRATDDSSEDEGEIIEDGELPDAGAASDPTPSADQKDEASEGHVEKTAGSLGETKGVQTATSEAFASKDGSAEVHAESVESSNGGVSAAGEEAGKEE